MIAQRGVYLPAFRVSRACRYAVGAVSRAGYRRRALLGSIYVAVAYCDTASASRSFAPNFKVSGVGMNAG